MSARKMSSEVFVTCAVTGAGATTEASELVPVTPEQIGGAAVEAAEAGAAIVHIHVRDPATGAAARDPELYREVVEVIKASGVDVVLNLTGGMGSDLLLGSTEQPLPPDPDGTDLAGAAERLAHVEQLLPEICTIDCGTMNWVGDPNYVTVHTQGIVSAMAARALELGVKPELEVFDWGHLDTVRELVKAELLADPVLVQLCMGLRYGAPANLESLAGLVAQLEEDWVFSAFSIGARQLPYVGLAAYAGGNVRVGLEDNLYLSRGQLATNGDLVERAVALLDAINVRVLGPAEVRERLGLEKRW